MVASNHNQNDDRKNINVGKKNCYYDSQYENL